MKQIVASVVFSCLTMFAWGQSDVFNIGFDDTYTGCDAIMHDASGGLAPYSPNLNNQITLCPGPGETQINLYFIGFSVSVGDVLAIYDGPSTNSPLIGAYDQSELLWQTISPSASNVSGCLTVTFVSNGDNNTGDFSVRLVCGVPCDFPVADINAESDTIKICPGEPVQFDASESVLEDTQPAGFAWDFGDGTTNESDWPIVSHTFNEPGGYRVGLNIEDSNGCISQNIPQVIVLVSTPYSFSLAASEDVICLGNSVLLGTEAFINNTGGGTSDDLQNGSSLSWVEDYDVDFDNAIYIPDNQGCLETEIVFTQFGNEVIDNVNEITRVYFNMEHSFVGDITIRVICPNGQTMSIFPEAGGSGTYLGEPIDDVSGGPAGVGYDYSFSPNSTGGTWMEYIANVGGQTIAAGDYEPEGSFDDLIGCPMNGSWTLEVCDIVGADDGFLFEFGVQFGAQYYPEALQFTPSVGNGCDSSYWVNSSIFSSIGENCDWAVFNPAAPGSYTFEYEVVNDFGCVFTDEISIEVTPGPQVSVNNIDAYCSTPQELVAVIQNAAPGAPYAYSWSPSTGLSSPVIASPDVIGLTETTTGLQICDGREFYH
jgi:subtilisin-like proprotein convertase family protein